jgi:hypothetical protein
MTQDQLINVLVTITLIETRAAIGLRVTFADHLPFLVGRHSTAGDPKPLEIVEAEVYGSYQNNSAAVDHVVGLHRLCRV